MRKSGFTLVELMVCTAIVAIIGAGALRVGRTSRMQGLAELQRARAELLLDYEAGRVATGRSPDPAVVARLTAQLPDAQVTVTPQGETALIAVDWRPADMAAARAELVVFAGRAR